MSDLDTYPLNGASFVIERVEGDVMAVNSFLIHGPEGIVVVDGQLTVPDARKVKAAVARTGRPLAGLVVTHPHPDHYAGAGLICGDAPILATPDVDAVIRRDDGLKADIVGPMMGEAWPPHRRFPDRLVEPGTTVELGGVPLHVRTLGPGESDADTTWSIDDRTIFVGDVVYNHMHAYLADAHHHAWSQLLEALEAVVPDDVRLFPGHGTPTGKSALARQRRYVDTFVGAVQEYAGAEPEVRRQAVLDRMRTLLDDDRLLFLTELSIDPVLDDLAGTRR